MVHVCLIRISPRAQAFWGQHGGGRQVVIQLREIGSGGCCSAGAAVSLLLVEREQADNPDWIDLGEWDGVPVMAHRALISFLEAHPVEIDLGGFGPFHSLRLRSDADIDMWCLFGDEPFAPPKPGWP